MRRRPPRPGCVFLFEDYPDSEFSPMSEADRHYEFEWFLEEFQHPAHADIMRWHDDGGRP